MISTRLNWFLETNNLLTSAQTGFRQHLSTKENVIQLSQDVKEAFNKKQDTLAVFIDFEKAYDSVWRYKLVEKLAKLGVNNNIFNWIT